MTDAQKKAYNKEYYEKYRKKGTKKGRKKGSSKKTSTKTTNLVGVSNSGLNDEGKMELALVKEKLKKQMNEELTKAGSDAEKDEIRRKYQKQALDAVAKLKQDSRYAKPQTAKEKAAKTGGSSGSSKSGGSRSSSGSGSSGGRSGGSGGSSAGGSSQSQTQATQTAKKKKPSKASISTLMKTVDRLTEAISKMDDAQKATAKAAIKDIVSELKKRLGITTG